MFFNSTTDGLDESQLENMYKQLTDMYQKKDEQLHETKDKINHLSKKLRRWIRKYHQLELSVSENTIEVSESEMMAHEEIKKLKKKVSRLSKKNKILEKQLTKVSDKCDVIDIQSADKVTQADLKTSSTATSDVNALDDDSELTIEFSPQFQTVLDKHSEECKT